MIMKAEPTIAGLGVRFAETVAAKDAAALPEILTGSLDFRAMTPGRVWDAGDPQAVADILFDHWFEPTDTIEELLATSTATVADRRHLSYRLRVRNADGLHLVEQQAYFMIDDEARPDAKINWMRVMCSGFRPVGS
jgi:hypothetical protein